MSVQHEAEIVLAKWGVVEHMLREADPESDDAAHFMDEWALLRIEYRRLTEEADEDHLLPPPPWPEPEPVTVA